jgi:hypothetical protein
MGMLSPPLEISKNPFHGFTGGYRYAVSFNYHNPIKKATHDFIVLTARSRCQNRGQSPP